MPPIISHSERQKIESSPQASSPHSLRSCASVAFTSSQPPPVPSLTPPPPRHYLRNVTSSEKLQILIRKRSDIYTRVQQAQQEELESCHHSARSHVHAEVRVRPILLTRSSSFTLGKPIGASTAQITRSASWKVTRIAPGHHRRSSSTTSPTGVHVVEFESLGVQRREIMVLGLSEVDAHFRNIFHSRDGASVAAQSVHHKSFDPNHGELEFKGALGLTTTVQQKHIEYVFPCVVTRFPTDRDNHQIRIEMPARDTRRSIHDSIATLGQDVVGLRDDETADSHHTQGSYFAAPPPIHSSIPDKCKSPQQRRARTLQSRIQSKDLFPPPRKSSLVGPSQSLDPDPSLTLPVGFSADSADSHTRGKNESHKSHSKSGGRNAVSKAIRHLGERLRSNACTSAPGPSVTL